MTLDEYLSQPGIGSMVDFARKLGVNVDQVRQWRHGYAQRRPSPGSAADIERATGGAVTCEELRDDIVWQRKADRTWPHPKGRPLHDVSAEAA